MAPVPCAGSGSWSFSCAAITVAPTGPGTVSVTFGYTNQFTLSNSPTAAVPAGTVAADYGYTFSIQNVDGFTVFTSSPNAVNRNLSQSMVGAITIPYSGTQSITSGTLSPGRYTATFSGSEHVFLTAVPEPGSVVLMAIGVGSLAVSARPARGSCRRGGYPGRIQRGQGEFKGVRTVSCKRTVLNPLNWI